MCSDHRRLSEPPPAIPSQPHATSGVGGSELSGRRHSKKEKSGGDSMSLAEAVRHAENYNAGRKDIYDDM